MNTGEITAINEKTFKREELRSISDLKASRCLIQRHLVKHINSGHNLEYD
jgi:hypothetical protein